MPRKGLLGPNRGPNRPVDPGGRVDDVKMSPFHWFRRKKRQGRVSPDERAAMQEAWLGGDTVTAIAKRMRRTHRTVRRAVETHDDSPPTESEAEDEEVRPSP